VTTTDASTLLTVARTRPWHRLSGDEALTAIESAETGLSSAEAERRLSVVGPNAIEDKGRTHPLRLIWDQVSAVMVLILIAAAGLSLALGKLLEAGAIAIIVVLFTMLGFVQEHRAERAIAALRQLASPTVRVLRNGRIVEAPAADLVPGDVVHLDAGTVVPADMRLVHTASLRIEEAALTGESEPVDKQSGAIDQSDPALGDRRNMAYSGTQVAAGRGVGVVVGTGMDTELGRIASLLQGVETEPTPLQVRLDAVGKQLAAIGVAVAAVVVAMGAAAGESASDLVLTAISVAVAVIPEGLPAVVTFTLAIGAQRMLRRDALVRKLPAVETLGSVTVICSDKTGTLTQNRMTVTVIDVAGRRIDLTDRAADALTATGPAVDLVLVAGALCNDGEAHVVDGALELTGDPTETALLRLAHDAGIDLAALRAASPRIGENPFDSTRKRMSTLHGPLDDRLPRAAALPQDRPVAFVKGAVDTMVAHATHIWVDDRAEPLDDRWRDRLLGANDELAAAGQRVLGLGFRALPAAERDGAETDITLVGLVGIIDPPRPEVRDAVANCRNAGIRPIMITGDHPLTAMAIARDLGIVGADDVVLTGSELDRLDRDGFVDAVRTVSVFARVSPEHKLRIVELLQDTHQQVVAMTGDGVNDAPALKRADIGVAMGITGTDVSKEASDIVLRDDNFTTIVAAVEEGRVIYDNLRRFVSFAVAGNLGKIVVMLGWPIPYLITGGEVDAAVALLPLQLLWLNLMTDGLLGLSIGMEPAERNVMRRPPHQPAASLWAGGLGRQTLWIGGFIGAAALGVGYAYHESGQPQWQTMIFTTLAVLQIFQAIGTRSNLESVRTIGWATNPVMVAIAALVVALQVAAVTTPLRSFLELEPLEPLDVAISVGLGLGLLAAIEADKARRRSHQGGESPATPWPHRPAPLDRPPLEV
jgi:Ca2+-transporting ATPase